MTATRSKNLTVIKITKLVYGGRGLGQMPNGKKVFVWNSIPGEIVKIGEIKHHRAFDESFAEEIVLASPNREKPKDKNYLDTSPWQMMNFGAENRYKKDITQEILTQQKINISTIHDSTFDNQIWHYRNKMEYNFLSDNKGLHLAVYERSSHNLVAVEGSSLANPAIDGVANDMCDLLNKADINVQDLKSIVIRSNQNNDLVASLVVLNKSFPRLKLPKKLKGLRVHYAPKLGQDFYGLKLIYEIGDCRLEDKLLDRKLIYDVDSFFQINLPVFEQALQKIEAYCKSDEIVDMYAGVGSIGLSLAKSRVDLIELNQNMAELAKSNAKRLGLVTNIIRASTDNALDYIDPNKTIIFDPPRSGLHEKVISKILEVKPIKIVYLSCNPTTQARDIYKMQTLYDISRFEIFNFFPRTPQIETLAFLTIK